MKANKEQLTDEYVIEWYHISRYLTGVCNWIILYEKSSDGTEINQLSTLQIKVERLAFAQFFIYSDEEVLF